MHHDRLMALAILADIFQFKTSRQIEVELHRGKLPETAQRIDQLDVDLRPIECGFANDGLVRNALALQHAFERADRQRPILFRADKAGFVLRIPDGKLDLEFCEAEGLQHGFGKVDAG